MSTATRLYLTAYNALNAALWGTILLRTVRTLLSSGPHDVYARVGDFTIWTQTLIVLDLIHVAVGLVKTSLITTLFQAYSRLFIVWLILAPTPLTAARASPFLSSMLVSWCLAEIVRYTYYVYALNPTTLTADKKPVIPQPLVWLRYNLFWVLYITGAGSEWVCMYLSLPELKAAMAQNVGQGWEGQWLQLGYWVVCGMLVVWPLAFPNQYLHMIAQRGKVLGGGRGKKVAAKKQ